MLEIHLFAAVLWWFQVGQNPIHSLLILAVFAPQPRQRHNREKVYYSWTSI